MPAAFLDKPIPVLLGTTPAMKRSTKARQEELFWQHVSLLERLGDRVDGVSVYDVWEGNERGKFRNKYLDNRAFAKRLHEETGKEPVICNVVVHHEGLEGFGAWLEAAMGMGLPNHVYVGASTDRFRIPGPHPKEAFTYAQNRFEERVVPGCITIPWRLHEGKRLAKKVELGARFAMSQIMLEAWSGKRLVDDLDRLCKAQDLDPPTVFWNFAPVVDVEIAEEDFDYFEVFPPMEHPEAHEHAMANWERIATAKDPLAESTEVAAETLRNLLEHTLGTSIKPGITAEGLGLQNLPYLEGLCRRLFQVRDEVVKKHGLA